MATMPSIEIDMQTSVGLVRPGDKLIIAMPQQIDQASADNVTKRLAARLPHVEVVIVNATALVVYRPATA